MTSTGSASTPPQTPSITGPTFLGHPLGLTTLFMTEFFERFTYYGMRALLVLFLVAATTGANPGFGIDRTTAGAVYGLYTGAVYLGSLPGGWIADRLIGQRNAILWGGAIIAVPNACASCVTVTGMKPRNRIAQRAAIASEAIDTIFHPVRRSASATG